MTDQFTFDNPIIPGSIWDKKSDFVVPIVSPVGAGPKGEKGDPTYFDDLTPEQLQEIYQAASFVGNRSLDETVVTSDVSTTAIEIPWVDYDQFDMLFIDVNGLDLAEGDDYTISGNSIVLATPLPAGQDVHFRLLRYDVVDGSKTIVNTMGRKDYNTVAEMQADTELEPGDICHTLGFHVAGDGGAAWYKIKAHGVANGMDIVQLDNDMVACLIVNKVCNVCAFGASGDGLTDNHDVLQYIFTKLNNGGGGTVYFPSGIYNISSTVAVGDNTRVTGDGLNSVLCGIDTPSAFGAWMALIGSNVEFDNLFITYTNGNRAFNQPGANVGFIGVTGYDFDSTLEAIDLNDFSGIVQRNIENINIHDITSDATYPLQTETATGYTFKVSNVKYTNIHAPNGVVSVWANVDDSIDNVILRGIICSFLRLGTGYASMPWNVTDVFCNAFYCSNRECNIDNVAIEYNTTNPVYEWIEGGTLDIEKRLFYTQDANVSNVRIDCGNQDVTGLHVVGMVDVDGTVDERISHMANVVVKNASGLTKAPVYMVGNNVYKHSTFVNCDFSNNTFTTKNHINGTFVNCNLGECDSSSYFYSSNSFRRSGFTFKSGFSTLGTNWNLNTISYLTDNMCHLIGGIVHEYFANGDVIGTVSQPAYPVTDISILGFLSTDTLTEWIPCTIVISATNGNVTIQTISKVQSNHYNRLFIDSWYQIAF